IVALGRFAVQCLLRSKQPITRLRGQWHEYEGIRLMPTFHPAYLLRNPGDKKLVWEDIQKVIEALKAA
ncbi:MAG TPA: uracil-DNA glycosylase family protein, partial [Candidatus Binatia bacterium]|nr:uracil-DNA glycosylase family protein [Candidatus Binatia bacterium]